MIAGEGAGSVRPGECHGIGGEAPDPRALAHLARLAELVAWLDGRVQLPAESLPDPMASSDPAAIEAAAAACRRRWGLAPDLPLPNLTRVVERAGVVVTPSRAPIAGVRVGGRHLVVLGTGHDGGDPQTPGATEREPRFALACLTGHVILHRDRDAGGGDRRTWSAEAERFARALLLPREGLLRELPRTPSLDAAALVALAQRWKVSLAALVARAAELPLVNAGRYRDLRDHVAGARPTGEMREPPEVISLALQQVHRGLGIRWPEIARRLGWTAPVFRDVVGLEPADPPPATGRPGNVISLADWKARRSGAPPVPVDAGRLQPGVQLELDFGPF
jgi:hypothetical protein